MEKRNWKVKLEIGKAKLENRSAEAADELMGDFRAWVVFPEKGLSANWDILSALRLARASLLAPLSGPIFAFSVFEFP